MKNKLIVWFDRSAFFDFQDNNFFDAWIFILIYAMIIIQYTNLIVWMIIMFIAWIFINKYFRYWRTLYKMALKDTYKIWEDRILFFKRK